MADKSYRQARTQPLPLSSMFAHGPSVPSALFRLSARQHSFCADCSIRNLQLVSLPLKLDCPSIKPGRKTRHPPSYFVDYRYPSTIIVSAMLFNLFLLVLWLLSLGSPVGDFQRYLKMLADDQLSAPDDPGRVVVSSNLVLSALALVPAPAPVPMPRYSPLVVPIYPASNGKTYRPRRFTLDKQISGIYRWMEVVLTRMTTFVGRPRATKTSYPPTKVYVPVHPSPPTSSRHVIHDPTVQQPTSAGFDPAGIWSAYKLIIGWVTMTFVLTISISIRFISRGHPTGTMADTDNDYALDDMDGDRPLPMASSESFTSLVDMYLSSTYPTAPCDNTLSGPGLAKRTDKCAAVSLATDNELNANTYSTGSALADAAFALPAWIDAKTGVEGSTEMDGASAGGKTLEPAVSFSSIGSMVGIHGGKHSLVTSSQSQSSLGRSTSSILARYPASGQAHSPRTKVWLESLITRVQDMQSQGDYHGRVYDGWAGNPDLDQPAGENGATSPISGDSPTLPAPIDSGHRLGSTSSSFATGLSVTSSQGSLYGLLESMLGQPTRPFDCGGVRSLVEVDAHRSSGYIHSAEGPLPLCPIRGVRKAVEAEAGVVGCDIDTADVPLLESSPIDHGASFSPDDVD
ncbi:unnamed protein product [Rhizoctonia solani]|uniref:Transmembrane protein n=1 Tax=Rhizoctonia solani TaxID=456999 RepID=A0A8H3CIE9_9AGAM|nr:unnamed protein product [Rhizoctonia solani]